MPSTKIFHIDGFRTTGDTFRQILERNFPGKILYPESPVLNRRLVPAGAIEYADRGDYRGVSSRSASILPEPGALHILFLSFFRDPRSRLVSTYLFEKMHGALDPSVVNFELFLSANRNTNMSNFQTRLLSPQVFDLEDPLGGGWDLNPWQINVNREDQFLGVVEKFDHSMVVLEEYLNEWGIILDASYAPPLKERTLVEPRRIEQMKQIIPNDMVELDEMLRNEINARLESEIKKISNFDQKMNDFLLRCKRLEHSEEIFPPVENQIFI